MVVFTELFQALKAALEEHDPGYLASWWDWLRGRVDPDARYRLTPKGEALLGVGLNERQRAALEFARKWGRVTNADVRAACPYWSPETIRQDLRQLVALGLLEKRGAKRGTYYVLRR